MKSKILVLLISLICLGLGSLFIYQGLFQTKEGTEEGFGVNEEIALPEGTIETETGAANEIEEGELSQKEEPTSSEGAPAGDREEGEEEEEGEIPQEEPEVVNIPQEILDNCVGFLVGDDSEISTVKEIGGGWIRPHPGPFSWNSIERKKGNCNFSTIDSLVKTAQTNEVAILATIWPFADWDQESCHSQADCQVGPEDQFYPKDPMGLLGIPKWRCKPCNIQGYKNFLKKLVERYDGDGLDDMPGLEIPIKYWEVLNEPEMQETFLTFFKGTKKDYVEILKASREAVKSVCSDCYVVQGGAAGATQEILSYWREILGLGGHNYFDIANIHYINFGDLNTLNVEDFKQILEEKEIEKPIWVTEAQYGSESQVEASFEGALRAGASKIFFTQFKIGKFGIPVPGEYSKVYDKISSKCR